jgi:hypothetical protein
MYRIKITMKMTIGVESIMTKIYLFQYSLRILIWRIKNNGLMKALTHGYAKGVGPRAGTACLIIKTLSKFAKLTMVMIFSSFQETLLE